MDGEPDGAPLVTRAVIWAIGLAVVLVALLVPLTMVALEARRSRPSARGPGPAPTTEPDALVKRLAALEDDVEELRGHLDALRDDVQDLERLIHERRTPDGPAPPRPTRR